MKKDLTKLGRAALALAVYNCKHMRSIRKDPVALETSIRISYKYTPQQHLELTKQIYFEEMGIDIDLEDPIELTKSNKYKTVYYKYLKGNLIEVLYFSKKHIAPLELSIKKPRHIVWDKV